jgi:hypothetical protein
MERSMVVKGSSLVLSVFVFVFFYLPFQRSAQSASVEFAIKIRRTIHSEKGTFGELSINDNFVCYTLEPAADGGPEGKGPIPAGKYSAHLRYDHEDHWRIELDGVEGFTFIQIHKGNEQADTAGCILVGLEQDTKSGTVTKSSEAFAALRKGFYGTDEPKQTPNKIISVEAVNP